MASTLIWSRRAENDLFAIIDWIDQSSSGYANSVADRIERRAENLCDQPRQGRRLPENDTPREIREVFVYRWRLIYEVADGQITLLAVHPSAMPIENAPPL